MKNGTTLLHTFFADTAALLAIATALLYLTGLVYIVSYNDHWNIPSSIYTPSVQEALTGAYMVALAVFDVRDSPYLSAMLLVAFFGWAGIVLIVAILYKKRLGRRTILWLWKFGRSDKPRSTAQRFLYNQADRMEHVGKYLSAVVLLPVLLLIPPLSGKYAAEKNISAYEKRTACWKEKSGPKNEKGCAPPPTIRFRGANGMETVTAPLLVESSRFIAFEEGDDVRIIRLSEVVEIRTKKSKPGE
ncbi:hypothetical protein [Endothiovibrio diazotrophicus]